MKITTKAGVMTMGDEKLTKWLEEFLDYGKHRLGCPWQWEKSCNCGFAELQAEAARLLAEFESLAEQEKPE